MICRKKDGYKNFKKTRNQGIKQDWWVKEVTDEGTYQDVLPILFAGVNRGQKLLETNKQTNYLVALLTQFLLSKSILKKKLLKKD